MTDTPDDDAPFTDEELSRMRRPPLAKRIRRTLKLSQEEFALRFGIPIRTLQEWEQGRREPDATTLSYLRVIEREPDAVIRALSADKAA